MKYTDLEFQDWKESSDQEVEGDFSTFLDFSQEKSNLRLKTELELKLVTAAQLLEVFIFNFPLFSRKRFIKNAFMKDCPQGFLNFKWLVECDVSLCFLFPLFLAFF